MDKLFSYLTIGDGGDMDKLQTYLSGQINWGGKGYGHTKKHLYRAKQIGEGKDMDNMITTYLLADTKGIKWARGKGLDNIINGREGVQIK